MSKIFIQIAAFCDPQLVPTIKDMLANAKKPKNLVFAIARQFNPEDDFDNLDEFRNDKRFKILDIPHTESKGVCWARHLTQQLYNSEEYTLQIDSHMRTVKDWDEILIKMVKGLQKDGYPKPLLTGYVPSFDPDNDPQGRANEPWRMVFDRFIPEGAVFFLPETIPGWKDIKKPVTARFYSAHFCFTLGEFSKEVQHNPEYYFHGEEISIAARAYTWGYDLFHPHIPIFYHEYTRKGRTKQWDIDVKWGEKNSRSHLLNRKLFGMDGETQEGHEGPYGFGSVRTLRDYEIYSGLLFSERAIQQWTIDKNYPPNPYNYTNEQEWKESFAKIYKHCIDVGYSQVPEKDYDFWVVAFHGENDETLFRKDSDKSEIDSYFRDPDGYCKVWREFQTTHMPKYWVVWPHSETKGWCERITGQLNHNIIS
jgi:hypothetical protein